MAEIYKVDASFDHGFFKGTSCAFGVFDGVHRGHRYLLDCARSTAAETGGASVALTFDIDPDEVFHPTRLKKLMTNEERVAFLSTFGWTVEEEPADFREVVIPAEFNDVYTAYNAMQNAQGFDMKPYAGEKCMQYRYIVTNYPDCPDTVFATLLVFEDCIIGGDVSTEAADGFMHGFAADSEPFIAPQAEGAA